MTTGSTLIENKPAKSRSRFIETGASAFATIGLLGSPTRAAQFDLKCGSSQAADHPNSVRMAQMWAAVKRETGGRVNVGFFPNSQLGGDAAMLGQARLGATNFLLINPGNLAPAVPIVDIVNLGFIFDNAEQGSQALNTPFGEFLKRETLAKGLVAVDTGWDSGMIHVCNSSRPIRVPEDLRSLKIRATSSRIIVDLFKAFDASAVPMALSDTYTALQTKLIDGATVSVVSMELFGYYEVQKYASLTGEYWGSMWLIANGDTWKSLPPDIQTIISRNAKKYGSLERRDLAILTTAVIDKLGRQGMAVNRVDVTPFRRRLHSYYESWASEFGATTWTLLQNALGRRLT